MKKALITGITGQDGSYLAELLIEKGYEVHGIIRRVSSFNTGRIDHLHHHEEDERTRIFLHYADLCDSSSLFRVINRIKPDEIYNLGAQSHVGISFETPEFTGDVTGMGVSRLLEVVKSVNPKIKFYQASSSELFGKAQDIPQTESTPFYPRSPYGCAKLYAFWITKNYREAYNMFCVNGILFNHESPRRGENFVTRKITKGLAEIKLGLRESITLGNLEAKRDWGYAKDYVEAMWLMLQQVEPEDYIIATGKNYTVRQFVEICCQNLGFELAWQGNGLEEVGLDRKTNKTIIRLHERHLRPSEVDHLVGDASKAKEKLGWIPKTNAEQLAKLMLDAELEMLNKNHNGAGTSDFFQNFESNVKFIVDNEIKKAINDFQNH